MAMTSPGRSATSWGTSSVSVERRGRNAAPCSRAVRSRSGRSSRRERASTSANSAHADASRPCCSWHSATASSVPLADSVAGFLRVWGTPGQPSRPSARRAPPPETAPPPPRPYWKRSGRRRRRHSRALIAAMRACNGDAASNHGRRLPRPAHLAGAATSSAPPPRARMKKGTATGRTSSPGSGRSGRRASSTGCPRAGRYCSTDTGGMPVHDAQERGQGRRSHGDGEVQCRLVDAALQAAPMDRVPNLPSMQSSVEVFWNWKNDVPEPQSALKYCSLTG